LLSAIRNLPDRSELRKGSLAFTLDLVERMVRQENVGLEHSLTIFAKYYLGDLYRTEKQRDESLKEVASVVATAQQVLGPDSRNVLGFEGGLAIGQFDVAIRSPRNILEPLMSLLKLLPRQIECCGPRDPFTPELVSRIRRACKVLRKAKQTEETRTALATAKALASAYKLWPQPQRFALSMATSKLMIKESKKSRN
jgi:hypothetical protein